MKGIREVSISDLHKNVQFLGCVDMKLNPVRPINEDCPILGRPLSFEFAHTRRKGRQKEPSHVKAYNPCDMHFFGITNTGAALKFYSNCATLIEYDTAEVKEPTMRTIGSSIMDFLRIHNLFSRN